MAWLMDGAPQPKILDIAAAIDSYGVEAVTGAKVIRARLVRDINIARNVQTVVRQREAAENVAQWARDEPEQARLYEWAVEEHLKHGRR